MTEIVQPEILVFHSSSDPQASAKFETWRRAHREKLGHYLNLNPQQGWFLHKARCPSVPANGHSADNEKRCAANRQDIEQLAVQEGVKYKRCQQCKPR